MFAWESPSGVGPDGAKIDFERKDQLGRQRRETKLDKQFRWEDPTFRMWSKQVLSRPSGPGLGLVGNKKGRGEIAPAALKAASKADHTTELDCMLVAKAKEFTCIPGSVHARRSMGPLHSVGVCLHLKKNAKGDGNTFKMGIIVVKEANGEMNVGLTNVGITAGGDFKATSGNTITDKVRTSRLPQAAAEAPALSRS